MDKILLPEYPNYACDEEGTLYSKARGNWKRLSGKSRVLSIRNEKKITSITRQKFLFCAHKQISPDRVCGKSFLISSDGDVITPRERSTRNNIIHSESQKKTARARLEETLRFTKACLDYLDGKAESLMILSYDVTPFVREMLNRYSTNKVFQSVVIDEARYQFLDALDRGAVTNPRDWIYARCRGIAIEKMKRYKRIKDYDKITFTKNLEHR